MGTLLTLAISDPLLSTALQDVLHAEGYACTQPQGKDSGKGNSETLGIWDATAQMPDAAAMRGVMLYTGPEPALQKGLVALARPFRLQALLRALAQLENRAPKQDLTNGWQLEMAGRMLMHPEHPPVALTEKESALLYSLLNAPGHALPRQQLLEDVWGYGAEVDTHTLETHLYRLRGKCREAGGNEDWIQTSENGYKLNI